DPLQHKSKKLPWWFWCPTILILVLSAALTYLWRLGVNSDTLPSLASKTVQLETAIQLEINAILSGDMEVVKKIQDTTSQRRNIQPPLEWLAGNNSGIELQDIQFIDDSNAIATINLNIGQTPYQIIWFYRQENNHWVHVDWVGLPIKTSKVLSNHVQILHSSQDEEQAIRLATCLEYFLDTYCQSPVCPSDPFTITVKLDPYYTQYQAVRNGTLYYTAPSPLRVRWPENNSPEPLVLGSLARMMAYDLSVRPVFENISPENAKALTLASYWNAHHILPIDPLPATVWLEHAVKKDGLHSALVYIELLSANTPQNEALVSSFQPETVTAIGEMPDFFSYLVALTDHDSLFYDYTQQINSALSPWNISLASRFDEMIDPWAAESQVYDRTVPGIEDMVIDTDWIIAITKAGYDWLPLYFVKKEENNWTVVKPDDYQLESPDKLTTPHFSLNYWPWENRYVNELEAILDDTHSQVEANFNLQVSPPNYYISPGFIPVENILPEKTNTIHLSSPTSQAWMPKGYFNEPRAEAVMSAVSVYFETEMASLPQEAIPLMVGLYFWQIDQIAAKYGLVEIETSIKEIQPDLPASLKNDTGPKLDDFWFVWDKNTSAIEISNSVFYCQSLVRYLTQINGPEISALMLDNLKTADSMEAWILSVTGQPVDQFEMAWKEWLLSEKSSF
ncbi:MAG: hypothetical protein JXA42_00945, partial [Anaerolineales bacterium]|nr:hypothetical protein [Anaerolineales bacterium]